MDAILPSETRNRAIFHIILYHPDQCRDDIQVNLVSAYIVILSINKIATNILLQHRFLSRVHFTQMCTIFGEGEHIDGYIEVH